MFIKSKKIKSIIIIIVLLIICTVIGVLKYRKYIIYSTRTISSTIDIGGYKLYAHCYGKGRPTVIFESGLGGSNLDWIKVQPQISEMTRTFSYDRAGIFSSDGSPLQRTSLNQVKELHTLLKNAKVEGPYIIVAHSLGGLNARLFAGTYPNEVAGIVFVDSANENYYVDLKDISSKVLEDMKNEFTCSEQNLDDMILSAKQVKEIRKKDSLRNIPIIVLSADELNQPSQAESKQLLDYQKDIASLSNKSEYIFVKNSSHYIQNDQPQVVIDAIKEIIDTIRK